MLSFFLRGVLDEILNLIESVSEVFSSYSEPSLFFSNYIFSLGFKPIQDDFQHDFARMTDEADSPWDMLFFCSPDPVTDLR